MPPDKTTFTFSGSIVNKDFNSFSNSIQSISKNNTLSQSTNNFNNSSLRSGVHDPGRPVPTHSINPTTTLNRFTIIPSINTQQCCCLPEEDKICIDPRYTFDNDKCECVYNTISPYSSILP